MRPLSAQKLSPVLLAVLLLLIICGVPVALSCAVTNNDHHGATEMTEPIVMVWEYTQSAIDLAAIPEIEPLNVVSPTWFHLLDSSGSIESLADQSYVNWAKDRGYHIWALFSNSFDPELTAAFLSDPEGQQNTIEELKVLAGEYELDGINVDFENFHSDYKDQFTSFIEELAIMCSTNNLVLSVDVTFATGAEYWSLNYDRKALAESADYIIIMAYDEHWAASPVAGSVASLPWVEQGLEKLLEEVPSEKLILGVPFYTRLFEIDDSGNIPLVLNSWSYGMARAKEIIDSRDAEIAWDDYAQQHVASYREEGLLYKMWLEDTVSMEKRLDLVRHYNLAGLAGWRRGLEKPQIWDLIYDYFSAE